MSFSAFVFRSPLDVRVEFSYSRLRHMRKVLKPPALRKGDSVRIIAPASPVEAARLERGCAELERLGYRALREPRVLRRQSYFAGSQEERIAEFALALAEPSSSAVICARGGYGSNYLLGGTDSLPYGAPKILIGHSDISSLQIYLWQEHGWVTFYGPMAAGGFDASADAAGGYDLESFLHSVSETRMGWQVSLDGSTLCEAEGRGILLGGCLTLVETSLGTPWALDTTAAILVLEDRRMKPYQVDRALMHLLHAGKLTAAKGIVLGEFPECEAGAAGAETVEDVCRRILSPLGIPVVWGAPVGHTTRPMKTLPLGVAARLCAKGTGILEILEPACESTEEKYEFSE